MNSVGVRLIGLTRPVYQYARSTVRLLFSRKYLLLTNTGITVGLGCMGDSLQQRYEISRGRQKQWDLIRSKRICVTSLAFGPVMHYWYILIDTIFPGRKVIVVLKKILFDQFVFSPINVAMFLGIMGLQEGMTGKEITRDFGKKGKDLLVAEWLVWPPAQMINFFLLPTRFRVLFDNTVSLGFDYYYSYVKFKNGDEDSSVKIEEDNRCSDDNDRDDDDECAKDEGKSN